MPTADVRSFVEGKIRRAELGDSVRAEPLDGPSHAAIGAPEVRLVGPAGAVALHADGLLTAGGDVVRYADILDVTPTPDGLVLTCDGAAPLRLATSADGGLVLHATLRWIARTRFRRPIA
jgi:hypothetical protein